MYSAVANGGTLYEPQLARAIVSPSGKLVKNLPPVVQGHVPLKPSTVNFLRNALVGVTQHGTAAPAFAGWPLNQIPVATKTGTAEVQGKQTSSVFASFAPANNPQYAIVMVVSQGGWGYTTSGFSVKNVYQALMGVNGGSIDRAKAIFPSGAPPSGLPTIKSNGQIVVNNTAMIVPILPLRTGGGATGLPASEPPYPFRLRT
jgi:penicillin-binding protein 2